MGRLPGSQEAGPGGEVELGDVGRLTGLFPCGPGGTLAAWVMTPLVLVTVVGGTLETHYNHLGGGHVLATKAHNLEIRGLHWW